MYIKYDKTIPYVCILIVKLIIFFLYAYGIVRSARWVFLGTSVRIQPEPESNNTTNNAKCIGPYFCMVLSTSLGTIAEVREMITH